jgi:hypothetical protein
MEGPHHKESVTPESCEWEQGQREARGGKGQKEGPLMGVQSVQ